MAQGSSHGASAIPVYHIGQSSGNSNSVTSSSSSLYHSERIQHMIESRRNFRSEVEFDIENSRVHWSVLTDSDSASTGLAECEHFEVVKKRRQWEGLFRLMQVVIVGKKIIEAEKDKDTDKVTDSYTDSDIDMGSTGLSNLEHFEVLKNHPEWGGFFKDVKVVLGKKINEGAQAEIYDAKVEFGDRCSPGYGYHVVKLMKGNRPLQDFLRQWPVGMLCNFSQDRDKGPLLWIKCGTLIDNRFGFVMVKQWGDLRRLIDLKMKHNDNRGPPFKNLDFVVKIMLCVARDMETLHTKYGIVHRDLKASNVLLWSMGQKLLEENPCVKANVVDYECSVGVIGTGFWRAPEILQQLKDKVPSSELVISKMSDVYIYGMTCYELLTGCIPFEGHSNKVCDLILQGKRPNLPLVSKNEKKRDGLNLSNGDTFHLSHVIEIIKWCLKHEPSDRPTFSEIVLMLGDLFTEREKNKRKRKRHR